MSGEKGDAISTIEAEWAFEGGFFWDLREGIFKQEEFERLTKKLSSISIPDDDRVPRRLVALLWYMPMFMQWQTDRVRENGGDVAAYENATTIVSNEIERLLGVP